MASGTLYTGSQNFQQLQTSFTNYLQRLSHNVSQIESFVNLIGTPQDSEHVRVNFHQLQRNTNDLAKESNRTLKDMMLMEASTPSERKKQNQIKENLAQEYVSLMNRFQATQKLGAEKEKASLERVRAAAREQQLLPEPTNLSNSRSPELLQVEQGVDLDLMREREDQIKRLEKDIVDVNQIFKDVAALVHEQGDLIVSIESSLDVAEDKVQQAQNQLVHAVKHKASARKKKIILIVVVVVVIAIIILILALTLK